MNPATELLCYSYVMLLLCYITSSLLTSTVHSYIQEIHKALYVHITYVPTCHAHTYLHTYVRMYIHTSHTYVHSACMYISHMSTCIHAHICMYMCI